MTRPYRETKELRKMSLNDKSSRHSFLNGVSQRLHIHEGNPTRIGEIRELCFTKEHTDWLGPTFTLAMTKLFSIFESEKPVSGKKMQQEVGRTPEAEAGSRLYAYAAFLCGQGLCHWPKFGPNPTTDCIKDKDNGEHFK